MKKLFNTNWFALTLSILAAIMIWVYVVYEINPNFERTIKDVPIRYTRQSEELNNGKLTILSKTSETVDVKVKGKRTALAKLTKDSVYCSVNMSEVNVAGTHKIPISVSFDFSGVELVSKEPHNVSVKVDKVVTEELDIEVEIKGTPADGYMFDSVDDYTDKIRISGAKSEIKKVKKAVIIADISGKTENLSGRYKIVLQDSDGKALEDGNISKNISYVELKCNILRIKEVPIEAVLTDKTTAGGKKVTVESVKPAKLTVIGSRALVDSLDSLKTEKIRTSYVKDGAKFEVKLEEIHEGIRFEETDIEKIEVILGVE